MTEKNKLSFCLMVSFQTKMLQNHQKCTCGQNINLSVISILPQSLIISWVEEMTCDIDDIFNFSARNTVA